MEGNIEGAQKNEQSEYPYEVKGPDGVPHRFKTYEEMKQYVEESKEN